MKQLISLMLFLMMCLSVMAENVEKVIDQSVQIYSNRMEITYVYVSKAMMEVVDTKEILSQVKGIDGADLIDKLAAIQIVSIPNKPADVRPWRYTVASIVSEDAFEKLLRMQNDISTSELYFRKRGKGNGPAVLLMVYEDQKSYKIIVFSGDFTLKDVLESMEKKQPAGN